MYRYSVDNAVTYSSEDFVLFRESPFASWMERLTLESPDHGIPPDVGTQAPVNTMERQDDVAETLRAEEREVALIDWDEPEPLRRAATLDAMRSGVDFVVNGQLALGPLSGSANLLMRTSGYSEFGNYLYIPCDTQARTSMHSGFRLSFLADLLHSLQGQLPPQMLIIRSGADVMPLHSEDTIHYYRAVKQRFMESMRTFRKHRMPDPAESSHFGRWSDCANEVLKQRAQRQEDVEDNLSDSADQDLAIPLRKVAGASVAPDADFSAMTVPETTGTLAEQARQLTPGAYQVEQREVRGVSARTTFRRGREARAGNVVATPTAATRQSSHAPTTPPLEQATTAPAPSPEPTGAQLDRSASAPCPQADAALENLEFIGSRHDSPTTSSASSASSANWLQFDQQSYEVEMPRSGFDVALAETPLNASAPRAQQVQSHEPDPGTPQPQKQSAAASSTLNDADVPEPEFWNSSLEEAMEECSPAASVETPAATLETPRSTEDTTPSTGGITSPTLDTPSPRLQTPPPNLGVVFNQVPPREREPAIAAKPHPLDSAGFVVSDSSLVDRDDAPAAARPTVEDEAVSAGYGFQPLDTMEFELVDIRADEHIPFGLATEAGEKTEEVPVKPFSDSLITNEDF